MQGLIIPMSMITFLFMGYDKLQAKVDGRRIPERVLLILGVFGGAIGGLLGMQVFRHKTRHQHFLIIFGIAAIIHIFLIVFLKK
jgi:uncharacterized membrane protein YsdA (DUF1294 family)